MLSAACPSCSATVVFRHAAALAVVCEACHSTVARSGDDLAVLGKVSSFPRELSPVRIGVRGAYDGRRFEVIGGIRRGREGVRWNEWYLRFEDDGTGWLGEGNGTWQIYDHSQEVGVEPNLNRGERIDLGGRRWRIIEHARARTIAAEGTLPFATTDSKLHAYADLRAPHLGEVRVAAATLDLETRPPTLYTGAVVALADLHLEGMRKFRGFVEDDTLLALEGPDLQGVRSIRCPSCTAPLDLLCPSAAVSVGCGACGSTLALNEDGDATAARLVQALHGSRWKPTLELGKIGTLDGIPWQLVGAMRRQVSNEWGDYPWTEYFLFNPYHGFRWLVEDTNGHWSVIRMLPDVPVSRRTHVAPVVNYDGSEYRHFQNGVAEVMAVLGEFTWQVTTGDRSQTSDFVAPPQMLSRDSSGTEVTWTHGTYLDQDEVGEAFGAVLPMPKGVAPHQPNPYAGDAAWGRVLRNLVVLGLIAAVIWGGTYGFAARESLLWAQWQTSAVGPDVFLSEPFHVGEEGRRALVVEVDTDLSRRDAQAHVALLHTAEGKAYLPVVSSRTSADGKARIPEVAPGPYIARVEIAKPKDSGNQAGRPVTLRITRDVPWLPPLLFALVVPLLAPLVLIGSHLHFEHRRWAEADTG